MSKQLNETITPKCKCPVCFYETDRAISITAATVKPGDLLICTKCGTFCVFREDLTYRQATPDELNKYREADRDKFYTAMMAAQLIAAKNKNQ